MTTLSASQASGVASDSETVALRSHKGRRQSRNKKGSDPFLELSDATLELPNPMSVDNMNENSGYGPLHSQSLLADLVLTPLNMVSFILSLVLVDHRQRQWRLSQHSSSSDSRWRKLMHGSWLDPQPYQDSRDTTWQPSSTAVAQNGPDSSSRGWYTRKKHRAMVKMEFNDAFEMRKRVIVALVAWMLLGLMIILYAARRMYAWMSM